jgi:Ca-activated chloride channel family protein
MTSCRAVGFAIALGLMAPQAFVGQQVSIEPRPKIRTKESENRRDIPQPNLRADTNLVLIPVEVSDPLNRPVSGLEKSDFRVFDEKVEQTITSFAMEDDPIAIGLVFDTSGSMGNEVRESRLAADEFFKTANPGDEFSLVVFDSRPRLVVALTQDPHEIDYQLMFTRSNGSTALIDAVYLALNEMKRSAKSRKALIIISDGGENNSRYTPSELHNFVRESDVLIFTIGIFGSGEGAAYDRHSLLGQISDDSGGRVFPAAGMPLADFAQKIITDLRNRYVLGFSPKDKTRDGRYHRVEVKLVPPRGLPPKLNVHWRSGYYAPSQ